MALRSPETYKDQHLEMDFRRHELRAGGELLSLTKLEWELLVLFINNPGIVLASEELWDYAWRTPHPSSESVKWHISNLRKKLKKAGITPIVTFKGFGYRYDA